jgi:hypothetical protein
MGKQSDKEKDKKAKKATKEKKQKSEKKLKKARLKSEGIAVSPTQRLELIATAAYYIAERHGFQPGRAEEDWREAELQIDNELRGG